MSQGVTQLFDTPTAIPVATVDDPGAAVELARALLRGGIDALEIVLRTPNAMQAAKKVAEQVPDIHLGIGTIRTIEQLAQAAAIGAGFGVSAGFDEQLAAGARRLNIPYMPGIVTASELMRALALGYDAVKVFPIVASGGTDLLRQLHAVFPEACFCPTGGISADDLRDYLDAPGVFSVGASWLAPAELIERRAWDEIASRARQAANICRVMRGEPALIHV